MTATDDRDPELLSASLVTASLFRVLRVAPIVGRPLRPEDEQPGSSRVVVLSESLWRGRFGADPDIVERSITLDGERYRVVGVMPRTFREVGRAQLAATADARVFLPMAIDRTQESRANHTLRVIGRLQGGVPIEQARNEMRAVSATMEQEFPASNTNWGVRIETLSDAMELAERSRERQAEPQPSFAAIEGSRALREGIEEARNELRRHARAVVFTGDTDSVA